MTVGVILYGPPASGKSTVTDALKTLDTAYELFPRLKVGFGRNDEYRMTTSANLASLDEAGELVWQNARYGATYAVDRATLLQHLTQHITVVHLGQVEAVDAIKGATQDARWLVVELRCARKTAEERLRHRDPETAQTRLHAFDQTSPLPSSHLVIDTDVAPVEQCANQIHSAYVHLSSSR